MDELSFEQVPRDLRSTATFAAAALHALAREEARGRKPQRLLEPALATWAQFRGRMRSPALLELLLEDGAVTQPTAFEPPPVAHSLAKLDPKLIDGWIAHLRDLDLDSDSLEYVTEQAKRLGVSTKMARSDLHRVKAQHQILELPGSGAQLAHHLVTTHDDVFLQNNFTIACRGWPDATLAGLIAVELGVSGPAPVVMDPELRQVREGTKGFDYVIGLDPDKGGDFRLSQLQELFPRATVLLV
ncbi:MAG: hypothetical protein EVA89_31905 [Sandaracinaceae bacterium]|nr:MAG: hypothetical protein EVA89_31905 [Sandaracinaceae bacterium]